MRRWSIFRLVIAALLIAAVVCLAPLPIRRELVAFIAWVQGLGFWGPVLLGAIYIPACLLFIPGSLLTLGAGFAFGLLWGTVAVSIGSVLGATAAFLVGRTLARDLVLRRVASSPRFAAIDRAVGEQGFRIVLLIRLSPLFPFNLLNYALGLTRVSLCDFMLASWLGMLPGTMMYVYLGSAAKSFSDLTSGELKGGITQTVIFFLGLAATVAVTVYITRVARRALKDIVGHPSSAEGEQEREDASE